MHVFHIVSYLFVFVKHLVLLFFLIFFLKCAIQIKFDLIRPLASNHRLSFHQLLCGPRYFSCCRYLNLELRAGDVELLGTQEAFLSGRVFQHDGQVDHVVSHHVLVLGWKDVLLDDLGWRRGEGKV